MIVGPKNDLTRLTALYGEGILINLTLFLLSAEKLMHYNRLKAENKINWKSMSGKWVKLGNSDVEPGYEM